jgi:hypothetical protein
MTAPAIAFLAATPILKNQPDSLVYLLGGLASFTVIAAAMLLAIIKDKQADEWARSNARFSSHWGYLGGGAVVALALSLPVVREAIVSVVGGALDETIVDDSLVMMSFTAGFMVTIFMQMIAILVIGLFWRIWMSRAV